LILRRPERRRVDYLYASRWMEAHARRLLVERLKQLRRPRVAWFQDSDYE
jgi:hypothetical protein